MSSLENIFSYYDKLIAPLSTANQAIISLILMVVLIWQIYMIVKSGHWTFIALLIILSPGTWPAVRKIAEFIWIILKFLFTRAGILIG